VRPASMPEEPPLLPAELPLPFVGLPLLLPAPLVELPPLPPEPLVELPLLLVEFPDEPLELASASEPSLAPPSCPADESSLDPHAKANGSAATRSSPVANRLFNAVIGNSPARVYTECGNGKSRGTPLTRDRALRSNSKTGQRLWRTPDYAIAQHVGRACHSEGEERRPGQAARQESQVVDGGLPERRAQRRKDIDR